ncbi:hypothetical protein J3459_003947 [Metarhizium acridum]|nr:hypothetical protein J3459_003947 [Metarhizium acridum]
MNEAIKQCPMSYAAQNKKEWPSAISDLRGSRRRWMQIHRAAQTGEFFLLCCLEPLDDGGASRGEKGKKKKQKGERQRRKDDGWTPPIQLAGHCFEAGWGLTRV